ncbi:uncharacterized protein LOC112045954 isoform X2 [Bicyclus anynana]|uniref:Uncharacterized protein LOC112045954 isoform X2 n=1 Tax=Bicyclus anynana TaxID=110368 RepID=A0A6J1MZ70_BICAN|nr:uncharacterized protein LOC112045954 isoform X2 [Bicyclus anynana]
MGDAGEPLHNFVKAQLKQSIKNADVLSLIKRMADSVPDDAEGADIKQGLEGILTHYETLDDDEKEFFLGYVRKEIMSKLAAKVDDVPMDLSELESAITSAILWQFVLVAVVGVIILLILVFFGYKLYKSIKDKRVKLEEKKKLKQMKKKK